MKFPGGRKFAGIKRVGERGFTFVEIIVAGVILSIGVLAMLTAFAGIRKSIQVARWRTLATSLAQDKMQQVRQKPYFRLRVTSNRQALPNVSPAVEYDPDYPIETLTAAGALFERVMLVERVRESSGTIVSAAFDGPETGLKQITVSVVWTQENGRKRAFQMRSVYANIDRNMTRSVLNGVVQTTDTTPSPIEGAYLSIVENPQWSDTTDALGNFSFNLSEGSYNLRASAPGFFPVTRPFFINSNATLTLATPMALHRMSTGTIQGAAWLNDHVVISQVVADDGSGTSYIELFNPTASPVTFASDPSTPVLELVVQQGGPPEVISLITISTLTIPSFSYYLLANGPTATINGMSTPLYPDALFSTPPYPILTSQGGALALREVAPPNRVIDAVWWDGTPSHTPDADLREGLAITAAPDAGFQFVRRSSTEGVTDAWGRCYDTGGLPGGGSENDFVRLSMGPSGAITPKSSISTATVISGVPAAEAIVHSLDGLSISTRALLSPGPQAYAGYTLTSVATGTWSVLIASGAHLLTVENVVVGSGDLVDAPGAATIPPAPTERPGGALLAAGSNWAFVTGKVTDAFDNPIPNSGVGLPIDASGLPPAHASPTDGTFLVPVNINTPPVTVTLTVNPPAAGDYLSTYVTKGNSFTFNAPGEVSVYTWQLPQGGGLRGFVSAGGTSPLPDIPLVAETVAGEIMADTVSDGSGSFFLMNLSTGTYYIRPMLTAGEFAVPSPDPAVSTDTLRRIRADVAVGTSLFIGTFTVSGSYGYVTGNVLRGGSPLPEGVTVVASTYTLSALPSISSNTVAGLFVTSSREDGTYRLEVLGSTIPYSVRAFASQIGPAGVTLQSSPAAAVTVLQGDEQNVSLTLP